MSATESKVKTAPKTSKKTLKSAEAEALKVALDAAQVEYVPVTALVKSPLNVRTIPYPAEKVCSMADSIEAIGLLQNLVVHNLPDGRCGVAAGGRRLKALQLLQSENRIDAGYQVMVKKVPDERKRAARTVLTGMCYSVGSATRQGSSSLTRFIGQSAITSSTWRR